MFEIRDGLIYKNSKLMLPFNFDIITVLDAFEKDALSNLELYITTSGSLEVYRIYDSLNNTIIKKYTLLGVADKGTTVHNIKLKVLDSNAVAEIISPYCLYSMEQLRENNIKAVHSELLKLDNNNTKLTIQNDFIKELFSKLKFDTNSGE